MGAASNQEGLVDGPFLYSRVRLAGCRPYNEHRPMPPRPPVLAARRTSSLMGHRTMTHLAPFADSARSPLGWLTPVLLAAGLLAGATARAAERPAPAFEVQTLTDIP